MEELHKPENTINYDIVKNFTQVFWANQATTECSKGKDHLMII